MEATWQAVTLWQPWQVPILAGLKRVENRSWPLKGPFPRWLALHVGGTYRVLDRNFIRALAPELDLERVPSGIYGAVRVDGVVSTEEAGGPWAFGPCCWRIGASVVLPEPVLCKGQRGLWTPSQDAQDALNALALPPYRRSPCPAPSTPSPSRSTRSSSTRGKARLF